MSSCSDVAADVAADVADDDDDDVAVVVVQRPVLRPCESTDDEK
jgi:hypothetical protein